MKEKTVFIPGKMADCEIHNELLLKRQWSKSLRKNIFLKKEQIEEVFWNFPATKDALSPIQ